ncbi:hypothetical protein [Aquimarina agarilytica]|uniref:hypothetical protein n=1 Tax=Aquimarina agarilytica TaxID=1087449 RepID=UPI00028A0CAF|nr:hypothetical protein [Aquimarina agarilytica]
MDIEGGVFKATNDNRKMFGINNGQTSLIIDVTWTDCSVLSGGGKITASIASSLNGANLRPGTPNSFSNGDILSDYCAQKQKTLDNVINSQSINFIGCNNLGSFISAMIDPSGCCNLVYTGVCAPCTIAQQEIDDLVENDGLSLLEKCNRIIAIIKANPDCDLKFNLPSTGNCP